MTPDERDIIDGWNVRQAADAGDDEPDLDERESRREAEAEREWEARRNGDYDA